MIQYLKNILKYLIPATFAIFITTSVVSAIGNLEPQGTAGDDTHYSLDDIYNRINTGATATVGAGTMSVPGTVSASFPTLTEIYNALPDWLTIDNSTTTIPAGYYESTDLTTEDTDLVASNIKLGATIFGISGSVVNASDIPAQTLSNSTTTVAYGVYATTTLDAVDSDLVASNIKSGTTIFGVAGSVLTGLPKTGQTTSYVANDDGAYESGVTMSYIDNGNSTITDNVTGLIWQKDGSYNSATWQAAITYCEALDLGGSTSWRLPNVRELLSLVDFSKSSSAINSAFTIVSDYYWSGTTSAINSANAFGVSFANCTQGALVKTDATNYVRCVR